MKFYTITCDETKSILPVKKFLTDKYIDYPFDFINLDIESEPVSEWTTSVLNRLKDIDDEYIILSLDDCLPMTYFNQKVFDETMDYMKTDKNIVRYEIGHTTTKYPLTKNMDGYNIVDIPQDADYRLSTQTSVWRTDYLFDKLSVTDDPWNFEKKFSDECKGDGKRMIVTENQWALRWTRHGALSGRYPNRINVLGIKVSDIKEMINLGYFNASELQYGNMPGSPSAILKEDFSIEQLRGKLQWFDEHVELYGFNYK
jgi:hypothetical protein